MDFEQLILLTVTVAVAAAFWRLMAPTPRLVVDERGILDRENGLGRIRWDEVEGAYPPDEHRRDVLLLRLRARSRAMQHLRRPREVPLRLSGSGVTPVDVLQRILPRVSPRRPPGEIV